MTTATVEQQTTAETMESFRKKIDDLAHDLRLEGIKLQAKMHSGSCANSMTRSAERWHRARMQNPVKIQQTMQPVEARIEGRKGGLIAKKNKALVALEGPYATLWQEDAKRKQQEELEKLQADRMKAAEKLEAAQQAWATADREFGAALRLENDYIDRRSREEQRLARERR